MGGGVVGKGVNIHYTHLHREEGVCLHEKGLALLRYVGHRFPTIRRPAVVVYGRQGNEFRFIYFQVHRIESI